jgi:hypothetical protein
MDSRKMRPLPPKESWYWILRSGMETIAQTQWFPFTLMGKMILSRRKRDFPGRVGTSSGLEHRSSSGLVHCWTGAEWSETVAGSGLGVSGANFFVSGVDEAHSCYV